MMTVRTWAWLSMVAVLAVACWSYGQVATEFDTPSSLRVWLSVAIGLSGLLSVFLFPDVRSRWTVLLAIFLPALLLRVLLLPAAPSDDVNRYLWEGKLVGLGLSPYESTADDLQLERHRDVYWEGINHKDKPTAYPPLSELAFNLIGRMHYHPIAFKLVFIFADLMVLAGVVWLLFRRGLSPAYSGFYALSPVILLSYAAEAHFDVLMVASLVWALCAYDGGRYRLAVALASIATGIKWVTLPLVPFFAGKRLVSGGIVALITLSLPAFLFWDTLLPLIQGLFEFGGTRSFNGPVYDLLNRGLGLSRNLCTTVVICGFAGVLGWRWLARERFSLESHLRWGLGALIVLSPTVHFWYLAWILPFVCLRPSFQWLSFSITSGLYFCVWSNSFWGLTVWQETFFWLPFGLSCVYALWSSRGRCLWPVCRGSGDAPTVAIVIPTYNIESELPIALRSVSAQSEAVDEVVVVDAGSSDRTVEVAESFGAEVVFCELGRGQQVAKGIESSDSEWVIVLHADAVLAPNAIACLKSSAAANPCMVGGAFGQRFSGNHPELLPIELLNDGRALLSHTAFGDQIQFFHRATAMAYQLMPKQALMEDVESSWRVREVGEFVFLGQPGTVSHRKWQCNGWLKRFRLVIRLVAKYRWARLRGRVHAEALSQSLYREYYGSGK